MLLWETELRKEDSEHRNLSQHYSTTFSGFTFSFFFLSLVICQHSYPSYYLLLLGLNLFLDKLRSTMKIIKGYREIIKQNNGLRSSKTNIFINSE